MKTKRLFKNDVYRTESNARVTSVSEKNNNLLITLDQTIFFPTGGGQSCDKGQISGTEVMDVYEYEDEIYHVLPIDKATFSEGDEVHLSLDWNHRFDNMQRHCGEHILSGMFYREFGGINRGFHMGDQYMTIDISLEQKPEIKTITWDMAKKAELCANEAIWQNAPVITRHFDNKSEAENLPLRKPLSLEKDITIVCVGSIDNPSDCVACCGTHPDTAGQVGLIKIFKVESNKGMFRIYFEAGRRAFLKYQHEMDVLTKLTNNLSAGTDDVLEKFKIQLDKNKEIRNQLHFIKKDILAKEADAIKDEIKNLNTSTILPMRKYDLFSLDDLTSLAREINEFVPKIYFIVHNPSNTVLLASNGNVDCGRLVKENASIYNGKGGGSKTLARAIFSKEEYVDIFVDLIEKHLR